MAFIARIVRAELARARLELILTNSNPDFYIAARLTADDSP